MKRFEVIYQENAVGTSIECAVIDHQEKVVSYEISNSCQNMVREARKEIQDRVKDYTPVWRYLEFYIQDNNIPTIWDTPRGWDEIVACFQTWRNGSEIQVSGFYSGDEVEDFIEKHRNSGTFATLHTFTNMDQAVQMYEDFLEH